MAKALRCTFDAQAEDAPRLAEMAGQLGYPATTEQVGAGLGLIQEDENHRVFVVECREVWAVGWAHVYVCQGLLADRQAELGGFVVDEAYHGRGVGRLLMERVERWAHRQKGSTVHVRSNVVRQTVRMPSTSASATSASRASMSTAKCSESGVLRLIGI